MDVTAAVGGGDTGSSSSGSASASTGSSASSGSTSTATQSSTLSSGSSQEIADRLEGSNPDDGASAAPDKPAAPAKPKYKVKRAGREEEHDGEELAKMLSDDHEWEFPVGKQTVKQKWSDITRAVQMGTGAMDRMREAKAAQDRITQELEWGQKNVREFLESRLGVEDSRKWALEQAQQAYEEDMQLQQLMQQNPRAYHEKMRELAKQQIGRKDAIDKARAEKEAQAAKQQEFQETKQRAITNILQGAKLPANQTTFSIAEKIIGDHLAVGHQLSAQDVADLTRQELHGMMHGYIDQLDPETLFSFLGNERRAKLRDLEIQAAKGVKKQAAQAGNVTQLQQRQRSPEKPMTEAEFRKQFEHK